MVPRLPLANTCPRQLWNWTIFHYWLIVRRFSLVPSERNLLNLSRFLKNKLEELNTSIISPPPQAASPWPEFLARFDQPADVLKLWQWPAVSRSFLFLGLVYIDFPPALYTVVTMFQTHAHLFWFPPYCFIYLYQGTLESVQDNLTRKLN